MRQLWGIAVLAPIACALSAGLHDAANDPAMPPPASATSLLNPWITFYASFDRDADADLAVGTGSPRIGGTPALVEGCLGRAVRVGVTGGGGVIDYPLAGNLDLTHPGAISFWISGRGWQPRAPGGDPYIRLVRLIGRDRGYFVVERDARQGAEERLIAGFFDLPGGAQFQHQFDAGPSWRPGEWHLIAVAWDAESFAISVDGRPFVRHSVPAARIRTALEPQDEARMVVGDNSPEFSLIDEFAVYARPLEDSEVARLWAAMAREASQG